MDTLEELAGEPPVIETALRWQDAAVREGWLPPVQARLRKTAIKRLWEMRDGDAEKTAAWLCENLDALRAKLVEQGTDKVTAATYRSRAASALRDFLEFQREPTRWRSVKRALAQRRRGRPAEEMEFACFPLEHERAFRYALPPHFSRRDLERIYLHLLAHVQDLDERSVTVRAIQLPLNVQDAGGNDSDWEDQRK